MAMATTPQGNDRVLMARRRLGLTQAELERAAKLYANDLVRIERQGWIPPKEVRARIAKELRTTPEELFGDALKATA